METLLQDLRYGLRMLVKKPTFTIVAVLTLALGVGANTAIFSIVNAVLLRSLPYRDPDRLVRIFFNEPGVGLRDVEFSKPEMDDLQTRAGVLEDVTPILEGSDILTVTKQPERIEGLSGSFSYFSMLGATPQIGRLFGPQDFACGFASVVVISDGLWHRSYGADPNVVVFDHDLLYQGICSDNVSLVRVLAGAGAEIHAEDRLAAHDVGDPLLFKALAMPSSKRGRGEKHE